MANLATIVTLSYRLYNETTTFEELPIYSIVFYLVATIFLGMNILSSIKDGFSYEYYFDLYILVLFVQVLSLVTSYANYGLLVVRPLFYVHFIGSHCCSIQIWRLFKRLSISRYFFYAKTSTF